MLALTGCSADAVRDGSKQKHQEFINGFEVEAKSYSTQCTVDGNCVHTYKCDSYIKMERRFTGDGNTMYVPRTKWKQCPYSTQETTFTVETTIGERVYAKNLPVGDRYRSDTVLPEGVTLKAPEAWIEAQKRLEKGEPRGVTGFKETHTPPKVDVDLQNEYADDVSSLLADNLLPKMPDGIIGAYYAEKAHTVEYEPQHHFLRDIEHINGALGVDDIDLDVHAVFIDDSTGVDPDTYTNALLAYWQGDDFTTNKLADNALVIVVGVNTETDTVAWARASGNAVSMNNGIKEAIQEQLPDKPMDENLFGRPSYNVMEERVEPSEGLVENILRDAEIR